MELLFLLNERAWLNNFFFFQQKPETLQYQDNRIKSNRKPNFTAIIRIFNILVTENNCWISLS